ncbi:response regulator transcription factor [Nitrospirillum amazonense]|uniref:Winged helix family two component transcriptional regulator n=1 Tax=Nitrospirillum amazonense TaxID=28077 RepID=A0A560J3M1_9PROT|nr:response regulator transcription factor [Nitrospirillum amazonense]MDG3441106.1 response regulator transcription factor [Nitrospirillum amazonense]TWB65637.1 winged helix family two component transcriptional regulator [Nitrospirillum amazonense]
MTESVEAPLVLIVEDEPATRALLAGYFHQAGFMIAEAANGKQTREAIIRQPPDLVLLDIELPDEDGFSIARDIREISNVGIIIVTRRANEDDRVFGLETGGDDYVTKPPNPRELLARARNLLRRTHPSKMRRAEGTVRRFGGWTIDLARRRLIDTQGVEVRVTRGEFELLALLVRSGGRVVTRDQLIDAVSGTDRNPSDRTIDVLVSRLRRKMNDGGVQPRLILTEKGLGYRLGADVTGPA